MNDAIILSTYGKGAATYEEVMRRYWHVEREPLVKQLDLKQGMSTLVAAVGTGLDLPYFSPDTRVFGIDYSKEMLAKAKKKVSPADIELRRMDIRQMDFEDNNFDAVLSTFTLCVLTDPIRGLEEMVRVAKQGAKIIIFDYTKSKDPEIAKWQELFHYHASEIGFPKDVICWDSLTDYDSLVKRAEDSLIIEEYTRFENANPFLTSCQLIGRKK